MKHLRRVWWWARSNLSKVWQEHPLTVIGGTLLALGFGVAIWGILYEGNNFDQIVGAFHANVSTELISIAITVLVIDKLNHRRATNERKEELILQMGSPTNDIAIEAIRILRLKGWLTDGSLRGAGLMGARLQGASGANLPRAVLREADLQGVTLLFANLREADLGYANLQGANMRSADLQGATLLQANLQGAVLRAAHLQGGNLMRANLQGAYLLSANLQGADLGGADLREALLMGANLQGTYLGGANLQGANLVGANLQGAKHATCNQLQQAVLLQGATLPDGHKLANDDEFEDWCKTVETDEEGYIIPAELDDGD